MKKLFLFITSLTLVAQQVSAKDDVEFSYKGVFSIEPGKAVVFATTNCENTSDVDTERFQWNEEGRYCDDQHEDYVLSSDEWTYLIVTRDAGKEQRDALGTVKGVKGLILLPDNWVQPKEAPAFQPITEGARYDLNVYNETQWSWMELAGAIFLPCQGYAFDEEEQHYEVETDAHGYYWARDEYNGMGYCMQFADGTAPNMSNRSKQDYCSVRLVRDVIMFDENDSQEQFADKFNKYMASDPRDNVYIRRYLLHNGYFNTICLPFEVTIDNSPLQYAEVFTVTSGTVVDGCLQVNIAPITAEPGVPLKMERGVPYLIRWTNDTDSVPVLAFPGVSKDHDWVENPTDAGKSGDDGLTYQGFFGMTHIADKTNGADTHCNFFLYNNNELCWPTDGDDSGAMMKGFHAYFSLTPSLSSAAPRYRGMPAKLQEINVTDQEDEATKLNQPSATLNCPKVFDADKVVIILDGKKYSIGGQEL